LSKSGSPNVWVCNADGTDLKRLRRAARIRRRAGRRTDNGLVSQRKIAERRGAGQSAGGWGAMQRIPTPGAPNPTRAELVAGRQMDRVHVVQTGEFDICVVPGRRRAHGARGGRRPVVVTEFADADFHATAGGRHVLSVLDVFTKQVKDMPGFQAAILNRLGRDSLNFLNELLTEGKYEK